jgi:predicted phosphodiesterase
MRRVFSSAAVALSLAWAASAAPDARFDGAPGAAAAFGLRASAVPAAAGRPQLPEDLARAALRLGLEAQLRAAAARPRPADGRFRFAVIGDAEEGRFAWQRVFSPGPDVFWTLLGRMASLRPEFVLQLGDLVSKGDLAHFKAHYERMEKEASVPFLAVIGNHDRSRPNGAADKAYYEAINGKTDFWLDFGGWRFVGLDTSDRTLRDDQMRWLESVVPDTGRCVIFTHVPPAFLKGKWHSPPKPGALDHSEAEKKQSSYVRDLLTAYFERNSAAFLRLTQERRVARVYAGHIHAFGVARKGPTLFVLSGGGGSPLYPLPPGEPKRKMAHFLEAFVDGGSLRETVHELDGDVYPLPQPPADL